MKITTGKAAGHKSDSEKDVTPAVQSNAWVLREIADTTWRMTIPVVIFTFIGIFIDLQIGSSPWITFLGVIVGFYFAIVLVKQQIKRSEEN
jgi:F0F1-type ATP synthase assembly protein I